MRRFVYVVISGLLLVACSQPAGPTLSASDLDLRAAIPGRSVAPGYLTLTNNSREPLAIDRIESPQYARIEIHETTNEGQISRMRQRDSLQLPAKSSVELKPGGLHLMLFSKQNDATQVTLNFYSGDSLLLSATTGIRK